MVSGRHGDRRKGLRRVRCDDTRRTDLQVVQLACDLSISADRSLPATQITGQYNVLAYQPRENEDYCHRDHCQTQMPMRVNRYPGDSISNGDRQQNPGWQQVPGADKIGERIQYIYAQGTDHWNQREKPSLAPADHP